jgi:hypothetical protein
MISPVYSKMEEAATYPGVKFYKVDVDEQEVSCALMSRRAHAYYTPKAIAHEVGVRAVRSI